MIHKTKERKFQDYFVEHPKNTVGGLQKKGYIKDIEQNVALFRVGSSFHDGKRTRGDVIGFIDVVFTHNGRRYVGEIKYAEYSNFWMGLKVLGYVVLYKWQFEPTKKIFPAILLPIEDIGLSYQLVARKLKITLFGIIEKKDGFEIKRIELVS